MGALHVWQKHCSTESLTSPMSMVVGVWWVSLARAVLEWWWRRQVPLPVSGVALWGRRVGLSGGGAAATPAPRLGVDTRRDCTHTRVRYEPGVVSIQNEATASVWVGKGGLCSSRGGTVRFRLGCRMRKPQVWIYVRSGVPGMLRVIVLCAGKFRLRLNFGLISKWISFFCWKNKI